MGFCPCFDQPSQALQRPGWPFKGSLSPLLPPFSLFLSFLLPPLPCQSFEGFRRLSLSLSPSLPSLSFSLHPAVLIRAQFGMVRWYIEPYCWQIGPASSIGIVNLALYYIGALPCFIQYALHCTVGIGT